MKKYHLCCGDIYLKGYINVDDRGKIGIPEERKTLKTYYNGKRIGGGGSVTVDKKIDIYKNHFSNWTECDEVVMVNAITHFTYSEARKIVDDIHYALKKGGKFLFDFPDIDKICRKYKGYNKMHFIFGHDTKIYGVYKWGYDKTNVKELLRGGWKIKYRQIVKHNYPIIGVEATKL
jgi:predicted SAM-dependent methyltransferase